ncbi:MAG TPA: ferritin [Synergistaceae bacterium]|nr:ferritin [Synergistaceae bacterium]HPJ25772.1 ferritin [Synergistaceae bacterium]HPQ37463.1 ferritin [Synergistaceae bacterium]
MMSEKLRKAMNDQINAEIHSAYLYFSMASWFEAENFPGMATWMKAQAQEEMEHAMKFYEFINDRRHKVDLLPIEGPKTAWDSPEEAFKDSFEHEQYITSRINTLMEMAREEHDYAAEAFLQWFITEQVEEEASVDAVLSRIQAMGDSKHGIFMLDHELGKRDLSEDD